MKEQPQKKEVEGGRGRMTGGRTMTRRLAKLYYVGQEISGEWRDDDGTGLRIIKGGNKNSSRRAFKCRDARACMLRSAAAVIRTSIIIQSLSLPSRGRLPLLFQECPRSSDCRRAMSSGFISDSFAYTHIGLYPPLHFRPRLGTLMPSYPAI